MQAVLRMAPLTIIGRYRYVVLSLVAYSLVAIVLATSDFFRDKVLLIPLSVSAIVLAAIGAFVQKKWHIFAYCYLLFLFRIRFGFDFHSSTVLLPFSRIS